jgi:hypothetical protein
MNPALSAFLIALGFTLVFFVLDFFAFGKEKGSTISSSVIAGVITFAVLWGFNFLILYFGQPPLTGLYHGYLWLTFDIILGFAVFGITSITRDYHSLALWIPLGVLVLWCIVAVFQLIVPGSVKGAQELASIPNIQEMDIGLYPDTDADHILLVPEEAAFYKAKQVMGEAVDTATGRNLSTMYTPDYGALQSVDNHLYWIYQLKLVGWRASNQAKGIVPGYIVIDGEDPEAQAQVRLGYKMQYSRGAPFSHNLDRFIYQNGYSDWMVDEVCFEVDDNWQPYYTAALCQPAKNFTGSIPKKMIIVDPQSGSIDEYALDKIPEWVDRVYSADVVKNMLEWWGRWSKAEWKWLGENPTDRMAPEGTPHLVYTKGGHPAWQVLMSSYNNDSSAIAIVMFEARENVAKVFQVPGVTIEDNVLNAFKNTQKNLMHFEPVHPAIHKIYGQLTWVAPYITYATTESNSAGKSESFQGLGLLEALSVQGADVIMEQQKISAFMTYRQWLAKSKSNAAPEENSLNKSIKGTIENVAVAVINGNTNYFLILDNDNHIFQGPVGENLELPFVKPGAKVVITYLDIGKSRVDISSYDDLDIDIK